MSALAKPQPAKPKPATESLKPILLYDHLPGILAAYPAVLFLLLGLLSIPFESEWRWGVLSPHMLFWIAVSVMVVWYIAFTFNMPKGKFWLLFGLFGTFIGIPVVLEITGHIRPFKATAETLQWFAPQANAGAYFVLAIIFFIIWLANFVWSRTHLRVRIDESGLTLNRLGGRGERFELIGLKTENEPLDYLELFIAGAGSLKLKTRMNKPIFTMNRVIGLYRTPLFPFVRGKLSRIEEMLSYQGKVVSVEHHDLAEIADQIDVEQAAEDEVAGGGEALDTPATSGDEHEDTRDIR
jgi:hypothetical protein